MKSVECEGKDIEQALNRGLAELDCKLDDVSVEILEHPGIIRKAKVRLTVEDGRGGSPAASEIMRDLEKRAKDARGEKNVRNGRKGKGDARRDGQNAQRAEGGRKVPQQPQAKQPPVRTTDAGKADALPKTGDAVRQSAPSGGAKGAFRADFRADLEAAAAGKPSGIQRQEAKRDEKRAQGGGQRGGSAAREVPGPLVGTVKEYIEKVVSLMGIPAEAVCTAADGEINAELKTDDALAIGRKGETLDALEYLATLTTADGDRYVRVNLDCGEYRARRNEAIRAEAIAAADRAAATGRRVDLESMNSASRREVHAVLGERGDVITRSEGREPDRHVVIIPKGRGGNRSGGEKPGGERRNNRNRRHRGGKPGGRPAPQDIQEHKDE